MLIYCHSIPSRLKYVADFIATEMGLPAQVGITNVVADFENYKGLCINYSDAPVIAKEIWVRPHGLLSEKQIAPQNISVFEYKGYPAFFETGGDIQFDIFSAIFYLISRYEEYLPFQPDLYGRYPHTASLSFRNNFLHLPLVNIWLQDFKNMARQKFSDLHLSNADFTIIPTYDIDIAWSYLHKGFLRNAGGLLRSASKAAVGEMKERLSVLAGRKKDPFDVYDWLDELHAAVAFDPIYFFLVAAAKGKFDKNISPSHPAMKALLRRHGKQYRIGVHPSWRSGDKPALLQNEIEQLEKNTGRHIDNSRQHFIRFTLPLSYRRLLQAGLTNEYSMGYGNINGFRASVASSFYWYDLENETATNLLIHPFCFMDATSFFEQKYNPAQALEELRQYAKIIKEVNGKMITIWHNTFFSSDKMFKGWKEIYRQWLMEMNEQLI